MNERNTEIAQAKQSETHKGGVISEVVRTGDILPGKVLEDPKMRDKLHMLLEKVGRSSGQIRFSHDTGVIYVSFPEYGETVILRGAPVGIVAPDYNGKGANIEFNDNARLKLQNYLARKKIQSSIKTSLADLSSELETSA